MTERIALYNGPIRLPLLLCSVFSEVLGRRKEEGEECVENNGKYLFKLSCYNHLLTCARGISRESLKWI